MGSLRVRRRLTPQDSGFTSGQMALMLGMTACGDDEPIKLDMVGISHISFGAADVKAQTDELPTNSVGLAGSVEYAPGSMATFTASA